ncbi:bis(5'-nucleosyl)-tetraphosphatase (symmetrical) ApaH [Candidatus Providencia siddallii]|uniref:Bis(5'-nucleosyl)-tetraphosphatase, symmetrical n=1 Tax=Candidatus Providencia siddallii TaxID=1715285 RepID=A0ABM9NP98_9GAMM
MSTYIIGDVHGCYNELCALLNFVKFNPQLDTLWLTGDLVSRGPESLNVLRYIKSLKSSVRIVLGNHDLHLIKKYSKINCIKNKHNFNKIIYSSDFNDLINWLRCQPLLQIDKEKKIIMTHAGIFPKWDLETVCICAKKIENILSSDNYQLFVNSIYDYESINWSKKLSGLSELCFIVNALTKLRYCFLDGQLDMFHKDTPKKYFSFIKPWFYFIRKIPKEYSLFFGHWASLDGKYTPENIFAMDRGCCWGGYLALYHWDKKKFYYQKSYQKK